MGEIIMDEPKSAIKHEGNYFIMDSEALVCNPFQDLQSEVMTEAQKKASLTEKLTSVKNNVCENHFAMEREQLEREKTHILKKLHDRSSKLRYEVKLLDLDRQKHTIEVKKRVMPERDYSYDQQQISNTEKRLGANIASFYLERKMRHPMRLKSVSDISMTPMALKLQDVAKARDKEMMERAHTAKTVSSGTTTASPIRPIMAHRRNSRSAPLVSRSYGGQVREETRLPAIPDRQVPRTTKPGHVKFAFEDPLKILMTKDADDGVSLLSRAYTYHPGMGQDRDRFNSRDFFLETSDDEDDPYLPDHIDLRALLFNREGHRDDAVSLSLPQGNHVPTPILRRSNAYAPKFTQDMIQQENEQVQSKVNRFLQELHEHANRHDIDSDDSDLEEEISRLHQQPQTSVPPIVVRRSSAAEDQAQISDSEKLRAKMNDKTPRIPKDAWKYIRGRNQDGSLKGTYSAEDLVLQTLTGVPLSRSLTAGIPLHSASRAMRHTATFKMRKVVERLVNERTKYQQHEIEELKRKMDEGDRADAAPSRNSAMDVRSRPVSQAVNLA
ncbi:hypothetical protein BaRGS_00002934 [Batillaria attramentaria]|uniref:Uncharacterized protein n=1 Tax=Batillaria attramentaria TaxID=370345 RepID=A0ABD0M2R2_9CAEN